MVEPLKASKGAFKLYIVTHMQLVEGHRHFPPGWDLGSRLIYFHKEVETATSIGDGNRSIRPLYQLSLGIALSSVFASLSALDDLSS